MDLPILIITYNRFEFVLRILNMLNHHGYKNVYISVDDYYRDPEAFKQIEFFLDENQFSYKILKWDTTVGCENNILEGIKWFFIHVKRGVILEDDCIPKDAFFSVINELNRLNIANENISFFSNNIGDSSKFFFRPSFIPFFWGWYSSREFFNGFYSFIKLHRLSFGHIRKILMSPFSLKSKLIILINYLEFNYNNGGTGWDSAMFFYQIINNTPFYVPSHSLIDNIGFGSMNSSFTHTDQMPAWCEKINSNSRNITLTHNIYPASIEENRNFLEQYYKEYPGSIKLLISFVLNYLKKILKRKRINNSRNVETSLQ